MLHPLKCLVCLQCSLLAEVLITILALNYAKSYYISENWWRCSSYAYKQIWILCQREILKRGSVFKVKRSNKEHSCFVFLFPLGWTSLATTSIKLFSCFFKSVNKNRFHKNFSIFGGRSQWPSVIIIIYVLIKRFHPRVSSRFKSTNIKIIKIIKKKSNKHCIIHIITRLCENESCTIKKLKFILEIHKKYKHY